MNTSQDSQVGSVHDILGEPEWLTRNYYRTRWMVAARNVAEFQILLWSSGFVVLPPALKMSAFKILRSFVTGIFVTQPLLSYCFILFGLVLYENGEEFYMRRRFGQRVAVWLRKFDHIQGPRFHILFSLVLVALCYLPLYTNVLFDLWPLILGPGVLLLLCYITMMLIVRSELE